MRARLFVRLAGSTRRELCSFIALGVAFSFGCGSDGAPGESPNLLTGDSGATGDVGAGGALPFGAGGAGISPVSGAAAGAGGTTIAGGGATNTGGASASGACPVSIFREKCQTCHNANLVAGAPMSLMTWADLQAPSATDPSVPVYRAVQRRIHDAAKPMPESGMLPEADRSVIDRWIASGAPDCGFDRPASTGAGGTSGFGGMPGAGGTNAPDGPPVPYVEPAEEVGAWFNDPPEADRCFNVVAHGQQTPQAQDTTKFNVRDGEFYHNFVFKVPYDEPVTALSTKPLVDNAKVLHHMLLFHWVAASPPADGSHADEIGVHPNSVLVSGWAPGGDPPSLPPGVGQKMPEPGGYMEIEFHYFNTTGASALDRSGIRVCTTSKPVENVATLTWLGTENILVMPNASATSVGTCRPQRQTDIHIIASIPHMHTAGTRMTTVINRTNGTQDVLLDEPFEFLDQRAYDTPQVVHAGDTLTTTCHFENTTPNLILFGSSTTAEMCYNFVLAYPADALANPGGSLQGSQNTCLH